MCDECDSGNHEECIDAEDEEEVVGTGPAGVNWFGPVRRCCCGYAIEKVPLLVT